MGSANVSFATTNFSGYVGNLQTFVIRLPLKYPDANLLSLSSKTKTKTKTWSANDQFSQKLAISGQFLAFSDSALVNTVSCTILNDLKTIVFTPIENRLNGIGLKFQNLQLQLPNVISSTSCVSFSSNDDYIWLDIIDSNYLLISLQIPLESFIEHKSLLSLTDFELWGKISVPYSFEMKSAPYFMKSVSRSDLIVALRDGTILSFHRKSALSEVTVSTFHEPVSSFIGGFFSSKRETEINGISSNAVVDVVQVGNRLVTLSVSKELKLWDMNKHQLISCTSLYKKQDYDIWLTLVPAKYLRLISTNCGENLITFFITTKAGDSKKSRFLFKTCKLENNTLEEVSKFDFQPELPSALFSSSEIFYHDSTFQNNIWFIQDYEVEYGQSKDENYLKYHILWKSNTSSVLVSYEVDFTTGSIVQVDISQPPLYVEEEEILASNDSDYYIRKIFDSGCFDDLIISTSISILRQHLKTKDKEKRQQQQQQKEDEEEEEEEVYGGLRLNALTLIESNSNSLASESPRQLWFKLFSLCKEFSKLSQEAFAITPFNDMQIMVQANGFGVFRPSNFYESISFKNLESPDGKLMQIFAKLKNSLSVKSYQKLYKRLVIETVAFDAERANGLFQDFLLGKFTDEEIQTILQDLGSIPGVLEIINSLVSEGDVSMVVESFTSTSVCKLGDFFKFMVFQIFKDIMQQHITLLVDLVVLLLICEANDEILKIVNSAVESIRKYNIAETIFDTCFTSSSLDAPVDTENVGNMKYSLFWHVFASKETNKKLNELISSLKINDAYHYFYNETLSEGNGYIVDAVIILINHNQGTYLKTYFLDKLSSSRADENFLIGLIYLLTDNAKEFFKAFEDYNQVENIDIKRLNGLKERKENAAFLSTFQTTVPSKSEYYHALSILCLSQIKQSPKPTEIERQYIDTALKFEQLAIENTTSKFITQEYYSNVFDLALLNSDYQLVIESLNRLSKTHKLRLLLERFIHKLIQESKIKLIFPSSHNSNRFFQDHYNMICSIISEYASTQPMFASLRIYEYLYSWRLFGCVNSQQEFGDKRGAIEALYHFITRFKDETTTIEKRVKLKILELYMIILNCMKTFPEKDQWLVKQLKDCREIIKIDQLKIEYLEWMKNLDDELSIIG
ncbi:hypothetical protein KGF56_004500 [Candida oxycetoniae]|uniref:Nucleoporin Nup120/160 beta-propeller domain-containing protein n=1 Tax=Candida oxycetoniae TaxID=497107 RepID=A0AAI9WWD0_9ASCO|nr:uncharacterized protein KGF56_004500 [Candida oxycetoniae]KAI3402619.2 hypothetical protein KGF56_004500 [Candida oxycetoniae]